jgi:hypothetical protein
VWEKGNLSVFVLRGQRYRRARRSHRLPDLDLDLLASFLDRPSVSRAVRSLPSWEFVPGETCPVPGSRATSAGRRERQIAAC